MSDQTVVDIEPQLQRRQGRNRSATQLEKADISAIANNELMILAACVGNSVVRALELKEGKRIRRMLLMIASGTVVAIGLASLVIQFLRN